ncbi:MAG TPA: phage tail protein [Micromonosporaceae bacterium]|jgi:phage tail-like protein
MADEEAVALCFTFEIDGASFGAFTSCDGLGCEFVMETREEGGNNGVIWQLPTRIKYTNIKLTRAICKDTATVMSWFSGQSRGIVRKTATIKAVTLDTKTVIAKWSLVDVVPVKWTGPSLSAENAKIATESIEFAHHGFLAA